MHAPPFRLARTPGTATPDDAPHLRAFAPSADCCGPSQDELDRSRRRTRLAELDAHLHCSIIGTCLSTHELRKLVPKFAPLDARHASDLEIHHTAVELAIQGGAGGKALQKALDTRYAGALRRFAGARDADAVLTLWNEARANGDIPPAYWALMSHPATTMEVRQAAFGELHMLSHLVGAANRADLRRLVALEEDNAELHAKIERQQARLHDMSRERDAARDALAEQTSRAAAQRMDRDASALHAKHAALQDALAARDARLALETSRREAAEQRANADEIALHALRTQLDDALALIDTLRAEAQALEDAAQPDDDAVATRALPRDALKNRRIVYVGGRPGSNHALRRWVAAAGGELTVHDGGIEDRKGLLAAALAGADLAVFPVDCIDHDSMNTLKRVCERHQVSYHPLRTASLASFVELMTRLHTNTVPTLTAVPLSRFCLRHG
ncbi:MAG: DUF2325 domain-containing protein [Paraburkholderia tropica]|uniref:Uncharacterized protein DUF2325 n=1 Tax=Paraburkholderia tropica TaxID=92647 RepID=A0AAQ1GAY4_9BURK|nr:DUF2325 domain-containing protein [Paraburkholderia tropica]MBB2998838.1 hypothetical protein [Paraburkholderia tropica]MBB6318386.1 hypothetical protein [Paraburkholderia tropica]MDE1139307.1 DUF2325 domain-containing protein [Paraburkholderia tropica]PXX19756.1 uncharacterized protein DUF2325 [Paraburkholderia tropica]PZW88697.1 uncharacterized protein DUF2325 [Paraburkholderia tropica]